MLIPFNQFGQQLAPYVLLPVLLLMLALSVSLYRVRRRKDPTLSLGLVIALFAAAGQLIDPIHLPAWFHLALDGAAQAGSVLIVLGLAQLFRAMPVLLRGIMYGVAAGSAVLPLLAPNGVVAIVAAAFFIGVAVLFGSGDWKFAAAAAMLAVGSVARLLSAVLSSGEAARWLSFADHWIPVPAFLVLFLILLNRLLTIVQQSYFSSITDPLTGLFNRRYFNAYVSRHLNNGVPVSILFSDIDNFKKLNDTKGHEAGDEALKHVASLLQTEVQDVGIAGRYGGEEMVLCVTDPSVDMRSFAERIRKRIEDETGVTASIGCSTAAAGIGADALIKQADEAMYQAKQTGKNKVVHFS